MGKTGHLHMSQKGKILNLHRISCIYVILTKFGKYINNIEEYLVVHQELAKLGICTCRKRQNLLTWIESVAFIRSIRNLIRTLTILRSI